MLFRSLSPGEGAFPQVSEGLSFVIDRGEGNCENILIRGKPIDPNRTYKIVTNSYLAGGGDGYGMFLKALDRHDSSVFQRDVLIEYIRHLGGHISPKLK